MVGEREREREREGEREGVEVGMHIHVKFLEQGNVCEPPPRW